MRPPYFLCLPKYYHSCTMTVVPYNINLFHLHLVISCITNIVLTYILRKMTQFFAFALLNNYFLIFCWTSKYIVFQYDCYTDIKSGAESGWDFASRWIFDENGELHHDLNKIQTRRVIPVDLNAFLYRNFIVMRKFYLILGQTERVDHWTEMADKWKHAIENVLYDEENGIW